MTGSYIAINGVFGLRCMAIIWGIDKPPGAAAIVS